MRGIFFISKLVYTSNSKEKYFFRRDEQNVTTKNRQQLLGSFRDRFRNHTNVSVDCNEAAEVLETALESEINFIDSADMYGDGKSELIFGAALKEAKISRDKFFIQSKGGIVTGADKRYDYSKQHLLDSVDGILERMGIDYLDSFLLHRPDPLMEPEEIAEAFDRLQASGKVRHFGVSNFNPEQFQLLQSYVDQKLLINQLQFSIMHTGMIDYGMHTNMTDARSFDHDGGVLEFSRRKGVTIQAW